MTFFNKKEDVIKIELTPYGRKLLGQGKFEPVYYTFLDDDILYDSQKAGFVEDTTTAKNRILKETAYLKPQTNYKGVETSINTTKSLKNNLKDENLIPERSEKLQNQLGTNNYNTILSAEISSTFLLGEISGAVDARYEGSGVAPIEIPQINCDLEYVMEAAYRNNPKTNQYGLLPEDFYLNEFKTDGSYVHIDKGEIMILFSEDGGFVEKDNFSIEVFEVSEDDGELIPLKFQKKNKNIIDDILYEDDELDPEEEITESNTQMVENHMLILVDDEISHDKICLGTKILKQNNIYVDLEVECEDLQSGFNVDLYQTSVTEDDLEDC